MEPFVQQSDLQLHIKPWTDKWSWLSAGVTSRLGGTSKEPFLSANYALHVGDLDENVIENRKKLCQMLSVPFEAWTSAEQTHTANIHTVQIEDRGKGRVNRADAFQETDGLTTDIANTLLTAFYADCVPLYFVDPVKRVIGIAHAGWKGTVQQIAVKMVEKFISQYGSNPADLHAAIGPAIGGCCYEVNDHVIDQVKTLPIEITDSMVIPVENKRGHYYLDLKEVNKSLLILSGIPHLHILSTAWCTHCHNHLFYSFRKESGETGRHCAWLVIREEK